MTVRRRRQALCLALAFWLVLCSPSSSRAFLTELVVGGQMLLQLGGAVATVLPQLSIFATSVLALAKSSEEVASTLSRIVNIFVPGKGKSEKASKGGTPSTSTTSPETPETPPAPPVEAAEEQTSPPVMRQGGEVAELMQALVLSFTQQMALLGKLQELSDDSPAREALGDGYSELVSETDSLTDRLVTLLLDGIQNGDGELIGTFVTGVEELEVSAQVAMVPVLAQVVEKGKSFDQLHDSGSGRGLFEKVNGLYQTLVR